MTCLPNIQRKATKRSLFLPNDISTSVEREGGGHCGVARRFAGYADNTMLPTVIVLCFAEVSTTPIVKVVGAVGWGGASLDIPDDVSPGLAAIIRSCWAEPEKRPSFGELIAAIRVRARVRCCIAMICERTAASQA